MQFRWAETVAILEQQASLAARRGHPKGPVREAIDEGEAAPHGLSLASNAALRVRSLQWPGDSAGSDRVPMRRDCSTMSSTNTAATASASLSASVMGGNLLER